MGCDIHGHIEVKIKGKWEHYSVPNLNRNYHLFAKSAGVRNYEGSGITPIAEPRGLPKDLSVVTRLSAKQWGDDGHSHSWLNASELAELIEFHSLESKATGGDVFDVYDEWGWLEGNGFGSFAKYPDLRPRWIEDLRFVFWFDN